MPVSPDLGRSIEKLIKEVAEVGSLKLSVDVRPTIDEFLRGEPNVNAGGIILGLSAAEMFSMGYSPEQVQRVLEAGIAELTQIPKDLGGL